MWITFYYKKNDQCLLNLQIKESNLEKKLCPRY